MPSVAVGSYRQVPLQATKVPKCRAFDARRACASPALPPHLDWRCRYVISGARRRLERTLSTFFQFEFFTFSLSRSFASKAIRQCVCLGLFCHLHPRHVKRHTALSRMQLQQQQQQQQHTLCPLVTSTRANSLRPAF